MLENIFNIFMSSNLLKGISIILVHLCNFDVSWSTRDLFEFFLAFPTFQESTREILNIYIYIYIN